MSIRKFDDIRGILWEKIGECHLIGLNKKRRRAMWLEFNSRIVVWILSLWISYSNKLLKFVNIFFPHLKSINPQRYSINPITSLLKFPITKNLSHCLDMDPFLKINNQICQSIKQTADWQKLKYTNSKMFCLSWNWDKKKIIIPVDFIKINGFLIK